MYPQGVEWLEPTAMGDRYSIISMAVCNGLRVSPSTTRRTADVLTCCILQRRRRQQVCDLSGGKYPVKNYGRRSFVAVVFFYNADTTVIMSTVIAAIADRARRRTGAAASFGTNGFPRPLEIPDSRDYARHQAIRTAQQPAMCARSTLVCLRPLHGHTAVVLLLQCRGDVQNLDHNIIQCIVI